MLKSTPWSVLGLKDGHVWVHRYPTFLTQLIRFLQVKRRSKLSQRYVTARG